LCVSLVCVV